MTHPTHADDAVGRVAGDMAPWALAWASDLIAASSKRLERGERAEALARLFDAWPKICRRMVDLERVAPKSAEAGSERDAEMQAVLARRNG